MDKVENMLRGGLMAQRFERVRHHCACIMHRDSIKEACVLMHSRADHQSVLLTAMAMSRSFWVLVFLALLCAADARRREDEERGREERPEEEECEEWLKPREPSAQFESEAGKIETWGSQFPALRRAGFEAARISVQSGGLLLPIYSNSHAIISLVEGSGIIGLVTENTGSFGQRNQFKINKGAVVAVPRGTAYWFYNNAEQAACLIGIAHHGRDTDRFRQFQPFSGRAGFSPRVLSQAWDVSEETVRRILDRQEKQGGIIKVSRESLEHEERSVINVGASDLVHQLGRDVPEVSVRQAGELRELNSKKLLALADLDLSARDLRLERGAIHAPNYIHNGDKVIYVVRGNANLEIVSNNGKRVVAQRIQEGELVLVPRGFQHVEVAGDQGFETFAAINTHRPRNSYLAGGNGLLNRLPRAIVSSALGLSRDDVDKLLRQREQDEAVIFPAANQKQQTGEYPDALEKV